VVAWVGTAVIAVTVDVVALTAGVVMHVMLAEMIQVYVK
jgi:hypothetical protein